MSSQLSTVTPPRSSSAARILLLALVACTAAAPAASADIPSYAGASADADTIFFTTTEALVPGDTDLKEDVYQRSFDQGLGIYVTREISTGPTGGNDAYDASFRGASENGDTVFFSTDESLVAADKDLSRDVYARLGSGATLLVSRPDPSCVVANCGNENAAASFLGASADGSRVFFSTDEQLTSADTDDSFDIYVRTLSPGSTELVSRAAAGCVGECGNGAKPSLFEGASTDGAKVTFSTAEALAPGDADQLQDIYQRDLDSGETALVSTSGTCPATLQCDAVYRGASSSGARVFFQTSERIGSGDNDQASDVYVWSGAAAALVSLGDASCAATSCGEGEQPTGYVGSSLDGRKVFLATSEPLTAADTDAATDIYARDLTTGSTTLVSVSGTCAPGLDCNAVYQGASADGNLVFFQTGERAILADTDSATDVYVRDLGLGSTSLVSAGGDCSGGCGNGAVDARFVGVTPGGAVAFFTSAEALSQADSDESIDVYARDIAAPSPATTLISPSGTCPLSEEKGCHVSFEVASEDGATAVFSTVKRLAESEDGDSSADIYARTGSETRLVSVGNSVEIGPATPILTGTSPPSPSSSTEPGLLGHAGSGTAIKVYASGNCSGAPVATGSVEALEGAGIPVKVESGSSTTLRATAIDASGEASGCSATAITYTQVADAGGGGGGDAGDGEGGGGAGPPASVGGHTPPAAAPKPGRTAPGVSGRHEVPQTRITFGPASKTRLQRPVFRFTDSTEQTGTTFVCRVDHRRWQDCSSPLRLPRLDSGSHALRVKGSNSGLVEPVAVIRKFKVVK
jgi:hypothetical protein